MYIENEKQIIEIHNCSMDRIEFNFIDDAKLLSDLVIVESINTFSDKIESLPYYFFNRDSKNHYDAKTAHLIEPFIEINQSFNKPSDDFYSVGRSGINIRNSWRFDLPTIKKEVSYLKFYEKLKYSWTCEITKVVMDVIDMDYRFHIKKKLQEYMTNEISLKAQKEIDTLDFSEYDCIEIHEFNKSYMYKSLPQGYYVINKKHTSRGNIIALLIKVSNKLKIQDEFKGIVIGQKGSMIKKISKEFKMFIKII